MTDSGGQPTSGGTFIERHGLVRYTGRLGTRYPRTGECEAGACRTIRQQHAQFVASARARLSNAGTPRALASLAALDASEASAADQVAARPLVFDHCHAHGWVRGLTCHDCNVMLGAADAGRLTAADSEWAPAVLAFRLNCPDCRAAAGDQ